MPSSFVEPSAHPHSVAPTCPPKTVILAEHHGYCHGVKKAVDKTTATGQQSDKPVYVLGQLIHNQQVIDTLQAQGIHTVRSLDEVPSDSVCVIRTHGAPPELTEQAEARHIEVTDATCPDVSLVQKKAIELARDGYTVVVVGKHDHPEVVGIMAHARHALDAPIVAINQTEAIAEALKDLPRRRIGVVSQTTQKEDTFFNMVKALAQVSKELKVFNTICPATFFRQSAALKLAGKVDFMVVVGGKNSSNTTHLAEICRAEGSPTLHVETYRDLGNNPDLYKAQTVGVTAGASTPDWLIEEVVQFIQTLHQQPATA